MLGKERLVALVLIVLCVPVVGIPAYLGLIRDMTELVTEVIAMVVGAMIVGAATLWYHGGKATAVPRLDSELDDRALCAHLTVHYSEAGVSIDTAHHPYYIVNKNTRKAYAVPARIKPLVRANIIEGMEHDGKVELERILAKYGLDLNEDISEEYPTDQELGIDVKAMVRRHGLA